MLRNIDCAAHWFKRIQRRVVHMECCNLISAQSLQRKKPSLLKALVVVIGNSLYTSLFGLTVVLET